MTEEQSQKISDRPDREAMEFFQSRYFVVNMNLLRLVGLWPYQSKWEKIVIRTTIVIMITISMIPQVISAVVIKDNVERFIQALGTLTYGIGVAIKFAGMIFTEGKLKVLYNYMVRNWKMLENENERHILEQFSEVGRLLTIGYIGYMTQAGIFFITLPVGHHIFDLIWPLANGSRMHVFVLDGEYFIDNKGDYYYYIYLFETFTIMSTVPLFSTIDSTYAVCIQQCVGLLEVVKLRLELATKQKKKFKSIVYPYNDAAHDAAYDAIAKSAELHDKVLNFAQVLESSYSTSLLFVMICNVMILATASVNILFNLNSPLLLFRFTLLIVGFTIHMFYLSWPGQKMIDGSNAIYYAAYNNQWYECSVESQKLLIFIMKRTITPFYLTCGGFYIMNFENFEVLLKTSVSYITVLASFNN